MSVKILTMDDEDDIRLLVGSVLEGRGWQVVQAASAEEGLQLVESELPDLIISDVNMGAMNGFEFLEKLREHPELGATPVVFLTSMAAHEDLLRGLRLGCDDYLTKPFNVDELEERVAAAVRRLELMRTTMGASAASAVSQFEGDLDELSCGATLTMLSFQNRTGLLDVASTQGSGRLWVRDGRVVAAEARENDDTARGLAAVHRILAWSEGHLSFKIDEVGQADEVGKTTLQLLMGADSD
ncbi:MAG: response regulator [Acidobacteriota bacterium]